MEQLLLEILEKVRPAEREKNNLKKIAKKVTEEITKQIQKQKVNAELLLGGSYAKDTYLKNNNEIDIFIRFDLKEENISNQTKKLLLHFNSQTVHGSRDYYTFKINDVNFEIIPVYKIYNSEEAKNSMDCSPLHVRYVKEHIKDENEVRLLKYYCKQNNMYGAESWINGFSGYVLELLVIKYRTFFNVLKESVCWENGEIIDIEKHYSAESDVAKKLSKSKQTPLIVIDPTQKIRNASNALSYENFKKFIELNKKFIENPSKKFFQNQKTIKQLKKQSAKNKTYMITLEKNITGKKDIFLSKLTKKMNSSVKKIEKMEFNILEYGLIPDDKTVALYLIFEKEKLSEVMTISGPPETMKEHSKRFIAKWKEKSIKGPYTLRGKILFDVRREETSAKKVVMKLLN